MVKNANKKNSKLNNYNFPVKITPEICSRLKFLPLKKIAEFFDEPGRIIQYAAKQNRIPYIVIDRNWRYAVWKEDYEKFLAEKAANAVDNEATKEA